MYVYNLFPILQCQMQMQDKLEKERADSKNAVEEYVYEMRDKIYTSLEQYVKEDVSMINNKSGFAGIVVSAFKSTVVLFCAFFLWLVCF